MEHEPPIQNETDNEWYERYEIRPEDLTTLLVDIDTVYTSGLIERTVLDELRFVTYDAQYLYICTRGAHVSNDHFEAEELPSSSGNGFRVFKVEHHGIIGNDARDYRGAVSWFLCDELETTAQNAKKRPNANRIYQPELPQPEYILDVVSIAPVNAYTTIHQGRFNYLTDAVFHEAGHIEERGVIDWREGDPVDEFPSQEQRELFLKAVQSTHLLPEWVFKILIEHVNVSSVSEMYAMLIDREAARRYDHTRALADDHTHQTWRSTLTEQRGDTHTIAALSEYLSDGHQTGRLLVHMLEERFPNFEERKTFVQSVLRPVRDKQEVH